MSDAGRGASPVVRPGGGRITQSALLGEALPRVRETDPEAYVLYLQCNNFRTGSLEDLRRGREYCCQSLEIDPDHYDLGRIE